MAAAAHAGAIFSSPFENQPCEARTPSAEGARCSGHLQAQQHADEPALVYPACFRELQDTLNDSRRPSVALGCRYDSDDPTWSGIGPRPGSRRAAVEKAAAQRSSPSRSPEERWASLIGAAPSRLAEERQQPTRNLPAQPASGAAAPSCVQHSRRRRSAALQLRLV